MTQKLDLSTRRILVTGSGRGIGKAVATTLAAHGARVAVHYGHDETAARTTRDALPGDGHAVLGADLADPAAALALPDRAAEALGGLDAIVNNAGIYVPHRLGAEGDPSWQSVWDRTLAVNLHAPARIIAGALPHLRRAGGGHIVNISSRGAFRGEPEAPAYGASKAGLNSLSQSLALALAPDNIMVVAVAPGWVLTDMTAGYLAGEEGRAIRAQSPLGRTATVDEVAQVVLMAVSGRADALTGSVIDVNCASYLR